jgi:hypothetical protein
LKKRPIAVPDVAVLDAEEEEQAHEREGEEENRELSYDNDER